METTKRQRLGIVYDFARANGFCKNKKTFAQLIDMNEGNMSNAFNNDNSNYLTDNLFIKINSSIGSAFSIEWLLYGTGEMYARTQAQEHAAATDTTPLPLAEDKPKISRSNERMIDHLEYTIEVQKKLIEKLEKENDALKKANTSVSAHVKHA